MQLHLVVEQIEGTPEPIPYDNLQNIVYTTSIPITSVGKPQAMQIHLFSFLFSKFKSAGQELSNLIFYCPYLPPTKLL